MAKLTTAEFIEAIKELSVLELNDLVKACEEEFGVSAAAGVVVAAAGAGAVDPRLCFSQGNTPAPPLKSPGISFFADCKTGFSQPYKAMPACSYARPAVPAVL